MKYRSDNPSHHEQKLLPRSYISLLVFEMQVFILILSMVAMPIPNNIHDSDEANNNNETEMEKTVIMMMMMVVICMMNTSGDFNNRKYFVAT